MNSSSITMESTDSSGAVSPPQLPPGFRFHPTDEELVVHYLKKKVSSAPLPVSIIAEVDLYKFDPWDLPAKATFGDREWYFFSPRDRKYPNGARPNRAATSGYWKATGTDKPVVASGGTRKVGVKKALVFYGGKPPKGVKTDWIMHEYRLIDHSITSKSNSKPPGCDARNKKTSLRLDDWVLCRIYKKNNPPSPTNIPFPPAPSLIQHCQSLNLFGKDNINPFEGLMGSTHDYTSNINTYISLLATSSGNKSQPPPFTTSGFINTISTVQEGDLQTSSMALAANDLFTHLPQTVVGSLSSIEVLRQNHHLPGFNWYS